jgi:uncharacterized membrane protein HdeD (DUF308 family)
MSFPSTMPPAVPRLADHEGFNRAWWLFLGLGIMSIIVGMLVIGAPHIATAMAVVLVGVLLVFFGVVEVIHAVMVRNLKGFALHLFTAALYLLVGLFILEDPGRAAAVLTLLLAAAFVVGGILRVVSALSEQIPAWPWVLLNGVVDLILAALIWTGWPESSLWVIGLFIGIDLLFHGWSQVILALTVRRRVAGQAG